MSAFDIAKSQETAIRRLRSARPASGRRPRSDRGRPRFDAQVLSWLIEATAGYERPPMAEMRERIAERCRSAGVKPPSRATVYKMLGTLPTPTYTVAALPPAVRSALYNLEPDSDVPGHQVVFYCLNYGDLAALSFAAGLPWLALYQARRLPGYRSRSRGLLEAIARVRGI